MKSLPKKVLLKIILKSKKNRLVVLKQERKKWNKFLKKLKLLKNL